MVYVFDGVHAAMCMYVFVCDVHGIDIGLGVESRRG